MKPQNAQTADRDPLDDVIDTTAKRMTAVADDEGLALRIVNALPERSAWLPYGWILRFAVGALAALAIAVVLRTFYDGSTAVNPAEAGHHRVSVNPAEAGHLIVSVSPAKAGHHSVRVETAFRPIDSPRRATVAVDRPDHEFSLPAIAAAAALGVDALAPANLAMDGPLTVASLELADLPMTADFSPR